MRWLGLVVALGVPAWAQTSGEAETADPGDGYTPDEATASEPLRLTGYLDVGFAKASGNGSSFTSQDTRVPLDYGVDAFAPAVNARGEVASTDSTGRFTNGFLPRSVGIGSQPSLLLNTVSADLRYQPRGLPIFVFARLQLMPRLLPTGDLTRVELQQAFGRLIPFSSQEFAVTAGRFDSVFGIEYLENEANLRQGITPSLIARYTTGQGLGVKAFYRLQFPAIWSAVSLNVAGTTNGTRIEALVPVDASLVGVPVGSARLGYELNLQRVQLKLGASGLYGPRNDQRNPGAMQRAWGVDARVNVAGVSLAGELIELWDDPGGVAGKITGQTTAELPSGFHVFGGWARLAYTLPLKNDVVTNVTFSGRYDRRYGTFENYVEVVTDRLTISGRIDFWDVLALKVEWVINHEISGTPYVDNNVVAASAVMTW